MIQELSTSFQAELKTKTGALDVTQAELRAATRELADQRRQIREWNEQVQSLDGVRLRARNMERALADEETWDWKDGASSSRNGLSSKSTAGDLSFGLDPDPEPPIPSPPTTPDAMTTIIRMQRMKQWYSRTQKMLDERIESCRGASAEKELQCRKVVSLCTGVDIDKVDSVSFYALVAELGELTEFF